MLSTSTPLRKIALPRGSRARTLPSGIGRGLRMNIDFHAGQTRLFFGLYELELNPFIRQLCTSGRQVFDIGSQHGYDALLFAKLTKANVLTVDAEQRWTDAARQNALLNPALAELIHTETGFVGATNDVGRVTIDSLAQHHFMPDVIKIDIEGGEAEALEGADEVLSDRRPALIIETHGLDIENRCIAILVERGYRLEIVNQRQHFREHRPLPHNRWLVASHPCGVPSATV